MVIGELQIFTIWHQQPHIRFDTPIGCDFLGKNPSGTIADHLTVPIDLNSAIWLHADPAVAVPPITGALLATAFKGNINSTQIANGHKQVHDHPLVFAHKLYILWLYNF
jgi:hypothetical protein